MKESNPGYLLKSFLLNAKYASVKLIIKLFGNLNNFVIKIIPFEKTLTFTGRVDAEWSNARKYSKELAINLEEKVQDLTKVKIVIWKRLSYQADAHYECIEVIRIPFQKNVKRRIVRSSFNNSSFGGPFHWRLE